MSGFIIGFDGEKSGAGQRIQAFVEETGIPQAHLNLLQALHNTAMWNRLKLEERLLEGLMDFVGSQKALMNFIPTRPLEEIVTEYIQAFWNLYEPLPYLKRTFHHLSMIEGKRPNNKRPLGWHELKLFSAVCWRQGFVRSTRFHFWWQMLAMAFQKPHLFYDYFVALGFGEHFFTLRHEVKAQLEEQLEVWKQQKQVQQEDANLQFSPVS